MLVQIYGYWYWQKYQLAEYMGISIDFTHIGPTIALKPISVFSFGFDQAGKKSIG
jgi:hypothetical protein